MLGFAPQSRHGFQAATWQRCQCHLQRNGASCVSRSERRSEVAADIRRVFGAETDGDARERLREAVEKWNESEPKLATWMEENVPEGLGVLAILSAHRKRLRTSNGIERVNLKIKRRTRVATLFPNEASLLRRVSAVLMEQSEEWETGRRYLSME